MRKIYKSAFVFLGLVLSLSFLSSAYAGISSVEYVHNSMSRLKQIDVPIPETAQPKSVTSVKYLMKQIDRANEILNGFKTTDYANSDKVLEKTVIMKANVDKHIDELVQKWNGFEFTIENVNSFDFQISAAGNFSIDWGDGTVDAINKPGTEDVKYSHSYSKWGNYTIRLMGKATGYSNSQVAAISFDKSSNKKNIKTISIGLGDIFSTLPNGENPKFYRTFYDCTGLTGSIPSGLFSGISGAPTDYMFAFTFYDCSNLTGTIPPELFGNISGAPAEGMFAETFNGCKRLTGTIPPKLFGNISGAPAEYMFSRTFARCYGLTGSIPAGLFGNISGAPATRMFLSTFSACEGLDGSIPPGLFGDISGAAAERMFAGTFFGCSGLTGAIPSGLFGTISGDPANAMFQQTFFGCSSLTSIEDGIWDLSNVAKSYPTEAFHFTFYNCYNLASRSPSIKAGSDVKLWEHFPLNHGQGTFGYATKLKDYNAISSYWK